MSADNLSRTETGDYGPPADEVIERLAEVLEADPLELLRVAGWEASGDTFEARVLSELKAIRSGLERLEEAVSARARLVRLTGPRTRDAYVTLVRSPPKGA